jgi:hypothetical protein
MMLENDDDRLIAVGIAAYLGLRSSVPAIAWRFRRAGTT